MFFSNYFKIFTVKILNIIKYYLITNKEEKKLKWNTLKI